MLHNKSENLLTSKIANSLSEEKIQTPEFYLLQKIHKANNPGRPVILLIVTPVQVQNMLNITYRLKCRDLNPILKTIKILLKKLKP